MPGTHGVYVIYARDLRVLHVGRTVRGHYGLHRRLKNHLYGKSSFAIQYLKGRGSRLRRDYTFSYIEVADSRLRALLESLAIGILCPRHLGVGNIIA